MNLLVCRGGTHVGLVFSLFVERWCRTVDGRWAGRWPWTSLSLHRSGKYKFSFFFTVLVFFAGYDRTQQTEAQTKRKDTEEIVVW